MAKGQKSANLRIFKIDDDDGFIVKVDQHRVTELNCINFVYRLQHHQSHNFKDFNNVAFLSMVEAKENTPLLKRWGLKQCGGRSKTTWQLLGRTPVKVLMVTTIESFLLFFVKLAVNKICSTLPLLMTDILNIDF